MNFSLLFKGNLFHANFYKCFDSIYEQLCFKTIQILLSSEFAP